MTVYQVDIQTVNAGVYITNVWHVNAADMDAAEGEGRAIAINMQALLTPDQIIDYIRISTPTPRDGVFRGVPVNYPGTRTTGGEPLPNFCRWRVDFNVGDRRPLRKFLWLPTESDQANGMFTAAAKTFFNTNFLNPLLGDSTIHIVALDGTAVVSGALSPEVGMRQLRRASKRKTPVI